MRKTAKENIIVVCTIVLCFMLTLSLCVALSGEGFLSVFKKSDHSAQTLYAIAVGGYTDITLARNSADIIKDRGGAGYVLQGESIEIIFCLYKSEDDASGALATLGDKSAYIKQIEIDAPALDWCDDNVKDVEKGALEYFDIAFDVLYKTSAQLNDGTITTQEAKTQIKVLYAQIEDIKSVFYEKSAECDSNEITETKLALITTLALLDNVDFSLNVARLTASLRYQLVQLCLCRQALTNQI